MTWSGRSACPILAASRTGAGWAVLALSTTITASGGRAGGAGPPRIRGRRAGRVWGAAERGDPRQHPGQQRGPVVGDDDDRDGLGGFGGFGGLGGLAHARYFRWPVKSPRSPAYAALALIGSRPSRRLVSV